MTRAQSRLIENSLDLVRRIAGRVAKSAPSCIEMDELISAGNLGLCQAAEKFDSRLHASFAAFASFYIRGRMIDSFRGPRYPRRWEQIPDGWLGLGSDIPSTGAEEPRAGVVNLTDGVERKRGFPKCLIDNSSPLDTLIQQEESVVVSIEAYRARKVLDAQEGKVLDKHLDGQRLTLIGRKHKKSACWAHTKLKGAKQKMRAELIAFRDKEAA